MRKVEYCKKGWYNSTVEAQQASDFATGIFHGFFSEGDNDEGLETYALVEMEDGTLGCMQTHKIRFITPLTEEAKADELTFTDNGCLLRFAPASGKFPSFEEITNEYSSMYVVKEEGECLTGQEILAMKHCYNYITRKLPGYKSK